MDKTLLRLEKEQASKLSKIGMMHQMVAILKLLLMN
jgi:hypothetical protein